MGHSSGARVIDLGEFRRRREEQRATERPMMPMAAATAPVLWYPVWVWMPVWPTV